MRPVLALLSVILIAGCASKAAKNDTAAAPTASPAVKLPSGETAANKAAAKAEKKASKNAAEATKGAVAGKAACKSGGDERLIEVVTKGEGGCVVQYTKASEMKEIANAEHETQHCSAVMDKVKGKLEAAGFTCN